jgi:hypothetical protein
MTLIYECRSSNDGKRRQRAQIKRFLGRQKLLVNEAVRKTGGDAVFNGDQIERTDIIAMACWKESARCCSVSELAICLASAASLLPMVSAG